MSYEIVFTDTSKRHFRALDARWRSAIKESIEAHLRHEPAKISKSRIKGLRDMLHPQFRLRIEDYRVFYDLDGQTVVVLAIVPTHEAESWLNEFGIKLHMITAPISEIENDFSTFIHKAAMEGIVVTSHGKPVAVIKGFADEDEYDEYRLLNDPRFHDIVAQSRREYQEGKITRLEDIE